MEILMLIIPLYFCIVKIGKTKGALETQQRLRYEVSTGFAVNLTYQLY